MKITLVGLGPHGTGSRGSFGLAMHQATSRKGCIGKRHVGAGLPSRGRGSGKERRVLLKWAIPRLPSLPGCPNQRASARDPGLLAGTLTARAMYQLKR